MTLLTPALLALGLAATVPLVLHLLQRSQGPRYVFPALRYLRRAEREHASRIRFRQILLLALRVLALLLLAAAAARPFLMGSGSGHEPTSVVLVLDNSLSSSAVVGDRRVLDGLRAAAIETLDDASPGDRFWLLRAGQPWDPAVAGGAGAIAAAVRETVPAAGAADLADALERAGSILAGEASGQAREIHLLSDLQASGLSRDPAVRGVALRILDPAPVVVENRGVESVSPAGDLAPRSGRRVVVAATISRSTRASGAPPAAGGEATPDSVTLRLVVGGTVRAARRVATGEGATLALPAGGPGIVVGYAEIDPDALAADDRRHFAFRVEAPPAVAVDGPGPFLEEALEVLTGGGRIRRAEGDADVVIAPAGRGADALRRGASVLVLPPASPLELSAANQRLSTAGVPWRFGPPTGEGRVDTMASELGPILAEARLRVVYELTPLGSGDTVLVRLRDGAPWAVAGATDAGRYVLLATPLVPAAGTIPTSAAMVPLLDRALGVWAAGGDAGRDYRPGDEVVVPAGDSVVAPGGRGLPVRAGERVRLVEPGVYRLLRGGRTVDAWAVNPAPAESDLTRVPAERLAAAVGGDVRSAPARRWADITYHRRLGREITLWLVAVALGLLLVEATVAAAGRRPDAAAERSSAGSLS